MNHYLICAFEMYKARRDDLLRQAAEDRLCRRLDGVDGTRRRDRYTRQSAFPRRSRFFPETNVSGSGVL